MTVRPKSIMSVVPALQGNGVGFVAMVSLYF